MTYVGDRTLPIGIFQGAADGTPENASAMDLGGSPYFGGDTVSPIFRPVQGPGQSPLQGGTMQGLLEQIMTLLQNFFGQNGAPASGNFFQNATGSSTGDPHLAFGGTDASGRRHHSHENSMRGHRHLLHSNSFNGGYNIATQTTQPGANGATYNQSATVTTGFGECAVTLDNSGAATLVRNGQSTPIADGASFDLGNGESVRRDQNGSVYVSESNGTGGSIQSVFSQNGNGVDVSFSAADAELDGYLVR